MSGVQSFLFWFPGPGARGSRLVGLWVTKTGSCQGYHDGTLRYGWLRVARTTQQNNGYAVLVGVVAVGPAPRLYGLRVVVHQASCCSVCCERWVLDKQKGSTDRTSSARAGSVKTEGAGRWTQHGTNVAKWEAGKANGPWEDAGPTQRARAGPGSTGRVLVGKGPLAGFRYQDARAGRRGWTLVLPSLEFVSVADA